jgi:hypothetical protein
MQCARARENLRELPFAMNVKVSGNGRTLERSLAEREIRIPRLPKFEGNADSNDQPQISGEWQKKLCGQFEND